MGYLSNAFLVGNLIISLLFKYYLHHSTSDTFQKLNKSFREVGWSYDKLNRCSKRSHSFLHVWHGIHSPIFYLSYLGDILPIDKQGVGWGKDMQLHLAGKALTI